jgi:polysaccharide export outer membrane protein
MLIVGVNILTMVSCGLLDSHAPHSGELGSEAYTAGDYKIGPEDVLEVNVWRNADLSKTVTVRPDGKISLPLVGDIQAMGLTAAELTKEVSERLKSFKESPLVSVVVQQINSYNVYFLGEVVRPGRQQFKAHTTILQAIISAGGFTQFASKNKIFVLRKLPGGGSEVKINVRYDDIVSGTDTSQNFVLLPGDTVVVP